MSGELVLERQTDEEREAPSFSPVLAVPEMAEDNATRLATANFIASVALNGLVETETVISDPIKNLEEGIKRGALGDETARQMVELNATTDITERSIKTGFVFSPVRIEVLADGSIYQHDQMMDSVQANSLRLMAGHNVMSARTKSEVRNSFRTERLNRDGYLDDYSFVVFSLAEDLPDAGFFTDTMSCSIQLTTKVGDHLSLQPALVSGIKAPGEVRHDIQTIKRLYRTFGVNIDNKTPAEIIDTPLLIHNSLLPNGVVDLVSLWDQSAGGTFFGENKEVEDYLSYAEQCASKQKEFNLKGKLIAAELFAAAEVIGSAKGASQLLNKISEKYALFNALTDNSIDARVFGTKAAEHLENSREHLRLGNLAMADQEMTSALSTAVSYSCPSAYGLASTSEKDEFGSLSFSCPHCGISNSRRPGKENFLSRCKFCSGSVKC